MAFFQTILKTIRDLAGTDSMNQLAMSLGNWFYVLLFVIVFAETGLVVTPFLPGDSLLFVAGALSALPDSPLNLPVMTVLLIVAAILGDAVNYFIGARLGPKVFASEKSWLMNKKHLIEAQKFYDKHGAKTIIMARFIPIVRTFAPFVAGIGRMDLRRFLVYNVTGGVAWVLICLSAGWFFGNWPIVKKNFELVLIAIIGISILPAAIEIFRGWLAARKGHSALLASTTLEPLDAADAPPAP